MSMRLQWQDEITVEEEAFIPRQETVDDTCDPMITRQGKYLALSCGFSVVPITEEMTNTISFLKAHGLYEKLSDESPIVSARIADMGKATSSDDMRHGFAYSSPIFNSFWDDGKSKPYSKKDSDGYEYEVSSYTSGDFMPKDSMTVTDKATLEKLAANAYGYRFDLTGGYLVEFKRANGRSYDNVCSERTHRAESRHGQINFKSAAASETVRPPD